MLTAISLHKLNCMIISTIAWEEKLKLQSVIDNNSFVLTENITTAAASARMQTSATELEALTSSVAIIAGMLTKTSNKLL